jgi:hypothetical protein
MTERTTWESIRTLFSPKTIPFLVAQGVPRKLLPVGALLLGMVLAFLWAYLASPLVNTAAEPVHMGESWKKEWVKQVAWQYYGSGNTASEAAQRALDSIGNAGDLVPAMINEFQSDPVLLPRLQAIQPFAQNNQAQLNKITPSFFNSNLTPLLCLLGLAVILGGIVIFNTIIPLSVLFARKSSAPSTVVEGMEAERRRAMELARKQMEELQRAEGQQVVETGTVPGYTPTPRVDRGTPVGRYISTYIMGDDLYDDSFSIETASGEFLGETGAGISKTIGVGDPKKVTAIEVFVFDKNDIRTVTKVLMSEHAFRDEALRAELAPKGEAVMVTPGGTTLLETQTLTVQARVVDLAYSTGALPTNSFFERLSVEISAWPKKAATPQPPLPPAFDETQPM